MNEPKEPTAPAPASPCVRECCLDQNDICVGCFRSIAEIMAWQAADTAQKRDILACAAQRRKDRQR